MTHESRLTALKEKAERACASAQVLLDAGDVDGACNRAYYAMFNAARAALIASGVPPAPANRKTHGSLISVFGRHLVKNGLVSKEMGRLLNRAQEIRQIADYKGDSVEVSDAQLIVEQAATFIVAIRATFMSNRDNDHN